MLEGKVVVVSGTGPGLGREVAAVALREGASVMLGARRRHRLETIAAELDPSGERVAFQDTDITNADQCRRLVDGAVARFGTVDALVNCAAIDSLLGGLEGADLNTWRATFETNIFGTMQMCQAAIAPMKAAGGSIVLIGSQASYWPQFMQTAYAATKGGLTSAMYYLAKELGPYRIRVNTVVPSWMWGPSVEGYVAMMASAQERPEADVVAGITRSMPLGEIPSDGDVAEAVAFFASDRARLITGQALMVNAGEFPH